jgi:hypothetical protein
MSEEEEVKKKLKPRRSAKAIKKDEQDKVGRGDTSGYIHKTFLIKGEVCRLSRLLKC